MNPGFHVPRVPALRRPTPRLRALRPSAPRLHPPHGSARRFLVMALVLALTACAAFATYSTGAVHAASKPWFAPWFTPVASFWTLPQDEFKPTRVAVGADAVWVADQQGNKIVRLDLDGNVESAWSGTGTIGGALNGPNGLALSNDGAELFVADTGNHRILAVSTEDWSVRQEIGSGPGQDVDQFDNPNDVDVWAGGIVPAGDGVLFAADTGNDRVVRYEFDTDSDEWQSAGAWGSSGDAPGQFSSPGGIALDHHQMKVWVADTGNDRIQVFEQDGGAPVLSLGAHGDGAGQFQSPQDLAFIPDPFTLLVADENNGRIQEWSIGTAGALTATYRRSFGQSGASGPMQNPQGVAADKGQSGDMYVADTYNHRVQLWRRDTAGPRTYAYKNMTVKRHRKVSLRYRVADAQSDKCYVEIRISRNGVKKKTLTPGWTRLSEWRKVTFQCKLALGKYTWRVYAKDRAGNGQRSPIGSKTLAVTR